MFFSWLHPFCSEVAYPFLCQLIESKRCIGLAIAALLFFSHLSPEVPATPLLIDGSTHQHFFLAPDAKHDLQAWVIIYHYSFSVSSALKVNRNASMLTDLLSKIFVPRFRSYDWCLSEFQVYALWKARWLDLQPPTPAPYITLVSDLQRPKLQEMYSTHVRLLWTVGPVYRPAKLRHWKLNPGPYLIKERQMRSKPMLRPDFLFWKSQIGFVLTLWAGLGTPHLTLSARLLQLKRPQTKGQFERKLHLDKQLVRAPKEGRTCKILL